jgi:hypothetical protein
MPAKANIIVVLPACNAVRTLERTNSDIPRDEVSRIILGQQALP